MRVGIAAQIAGCVGVATDFTGGGGIAHDQIAAADATRNSAGSRSRKADGDAAVGMAAGCDAVRVVAGDDGVIVGVLVKPCVCVGSETLCTCDGISLQERVWFTSPPDAPIAQPPPS